VALNHIQPPIQCVLGKFSLIIECSGCDTSHALLSSVDVKNEWSYTSFPPYAFMMQRYNFTGTFQPWGMNMKAQLFQYIF
jgi:hypothetical protein